MNTNMSLAIYESQELTETEKDYLLAVLEAGEEDVEKANKKLAAGYALQPIRKTGTLAAIGGGGSWLVLNNKLRKAEAELQKTTHLYNTATDKREKGALDVEIKQIKEKIASLEKNMKIAKKVGLAGAATTVGTATVQVGLAGSAGVDCARATMKGVNPDNF